MEGYPGYPGYPIKPFAEVSDLPLRIRRFLFFFGGGGGGLPSRKTKHTDICRKDFGKRSPWLKCFGYFWSRVLPSAPNVTHYHPMEYQGVTFRAVVQSNIWRPRCEGARGVPFVISFCQTLFNILLVSLPVFMHK